MIRTVENNKNIIKYEFGDELKAGSGKFYVCPSGRNDGSHLCYDKSGDFAGLIELSDIWKIGTYDRKYKTFEEWFDFIKKSQNYVTGS